MQSVTGRCRTSFVLSYRRVASVRCSDCDPDGERDAQNCRSLESSAIRRVAASAGPSVAMRLIDSRFDPHVGEGALAGHTQRSQRGFSLVEVLFALVVLSVAVSGLAHLFTVAAHNERASARDDLCRRARAAEDGAASGPCVWFRPGWRRGDGCRHRYHRAAGIARRRRRASVVASRRACGQHHRLRGLRRCQRCVARRSRGRSTAWHGLHPAMVRRAPSVQRQHDGASGSCHACGSPGCGR